jgi:glycosyltransferase involved in cell wall biosynthesis
MSKILFLTPSNPMGIGGGSFASHAYLRAFSDLYAGNVDVVLADVWNEKWDSQVVVQKKYYAEPLSAIQYMSSIITGTIQRFSGTAEKIIKDNPNTYSCVVCNGSSTSGKLWKLTKRLGISLITIHHNYEPEYFADNSKGLRRFIFLPVVKKLEREAYLNSDYNLFLTKQDKNKFHKQYGENNKNNAVVGVFEFDNYKRPDISPSFGNPLTFVITGSLCTMQGIDGIRYFFEELYQYLPNNCSVILAGRDPVKEVVTWCSQHNNVKLIPNPQNMSEVISSGDVYLCPTKVGGGIKLRVMDGLRLGLPVIAHACSARGYDAFFDSPYFKSFTNQYEFKKSLGEVLDSMDKMSKTDVMNKYKQVFSYDEGVKRIENIII